MNAECVILLLSAQDLGCCKKSSVFINKLFSEESPSSELELLITFDIDAFETVTNDWLELSSRKIAVKRRWIKTSEADEGESSVLLIEFEVQMSGANQHRNSQLA